MSAFIDFWMAKTLVETVIALIIAGAVALVWVRHQWFRQQRCNHPRISETTSCDAICCECGKNLGFIGEWHGKKT